MISSHGLYKPCLRSGCGTDKEFFPTVMIPDEELKPFQAAPEGAQDGGHRTSAPDVPP